MLMNGLRGILLSAYPFPAEGEVWKSWSEPVLEVDVGEDDQGHDQAAHHRRHDRLGKAAANHLNKEVVPTLKRK